LYDMFGQKALLRYAIVVLSFVVIAAGLAAMLRSGFGMGPWGAFEQVMSERTGITFGRASQLVGLVLIAAAWMLGEKPTLVTLMNMVLIGAFSDVVLAVLPHVTATAAKPIVFCIGLIVYAMGIAMYVSLRMGAGPREALMLGLSRRASMSIRLARIIIDSSVAIAAWIMGGPVSYGTAVFALGAGPLIQAFMGRCGGIVTRLK
jgi:uncharacterized membrane protein YczE